MRIPTPFNAYTISLDMQLTKKPLSGNPNVLETMTSILLCAVYVFMRITEALASRLKHLIPFLFALQSLNTLSVHRLCHLLVSFSFSFGRPFVLDSLYPLLL